MFPVEFELRPEDGAPASSGFLQGFTRDISQGGLCVELKSFGPQTEEALARPGASLKLVINPTFSRHPIEAEGRVAWLHKEESAFAPKWLIGVAYTQIDPAAQNRLLRFAHRQVWLPRLVWAAAVLMLGLIAFLSVREQELLRENRELVRSLVESAEKRSTVSDDLQSLKDRRQSLEGDLRSARETIERLEKSMKELTAENESRKTNYEAELTQALDKQKLISAELRQLRGKRHALEETARKLDVAQETAFQAALEQMTGWIRTHQNLKTGLVVSFEGDSAQADTAYSYDQSLAAQVFLLSDDAKRAELILSFYDRQAERSGGGFYNAYGTHDGRPSESVIHAGPNIWIGIAALQHEAKTKSGKYLPLARSLGDWVIGQQDREGGLPGGPQFTWYSTEHNLDAYAFLGMLYDTTKDERWREAQERVLAWLKKYSFSLQAKRINRGKGDATIATDTMSWSVAAIGPDALVSIGFMPEEILEFAEKQCEVSVKFRRPDGTEASVRGFDFAKAEHVGRGGIVSTEWTAQMIVSYQVLGRWFRDQDDPVKAKRYFDKSEFYLNELKKMVITSPSKTGQGRGCLPYASAQNADTGHGWRTPAGATTGSVAGTAYGIFAWKGFNPFELHEGRTTHADV